MEEKICLIIVVGVLVVDNQNVQIVGLCGLMLLQDVWFFEKFVYFDCEVIFE